MTLSEIIASERGKYYDPEGVLDAMLDRIEAAVTKRFADLEMQLPAVVEVSLEPIQKNVTGWNVHRCSCGQVVSADGLWKFCPSCGSKLKWEKV